MVRRKRERREKPPWILYMGTFPPRECGIGTFTKDLTTAIDKKLFPSVRSKILAINSNSTDTYNYPKNVLFNIEEDNLSEYVGVAEKINKTSSIKLVSVQHEFGIYGGMYKENLEAFLEALQKPVVITFHSVLPCPDDRLRGVVRALAEKSACLVVMTQKSVEILRKQYGIKAPIEVIPHGIPEVTFESSAKEKKKVGYKDRTLLLSFGLLSPDKGCENVINVLPEVVEKFPDVLYLILGVTHPIVRKGEGERYRNFLKSRISELGLQKNVKFYNKYVTLNEITKYLKASDIYICSNNNPKQAVSGTLAYAMGCGRTVISTPFLHARELVAPDRGILVEYGNPDSYTNAILKLLSNPRLKEQMDRNAYAYTRSMTWPNTAASYIQVFQKYAGLSRL